MQLVFPRKGAVADHFRIRQDGGKRRLYIVRYHGVKIRFFLLQPDEFIVRPFEFVIGVF